MKISRLIELLEECQGKYGDIEVLSCPPSPTTACGDCYFTDDLNVDCYEGESLDREGKQAVKVYGYV